MANTALCPEATKVAGETENRQEALWEQRPEEISSALEHRDSSSDKNQAEPQVTTKCLTSRDQEHCHHEFAELWARPLAAGVEEMLGKLWR